MDDEGRERESDKMDRNFADAMRNAAKGSDDGLIWRGGVLDQRLTGRPTPQRLPRKGEALTVEPGPPTGIALTLEQADKLHKAGKEVGCIVNAGGSFLLINLLWVAGGPFLQRIIEDDPSVYSGGAPSTLQMLMESALPLAFLGLVVLIIYLVAWYRRTYENRLRQALQQLDEAPIAIPGAQELGTIYFRFASTLRLLMMGRHPRNQREWTRFLANVIDLYLEEKQLFRLSFLDWLFRLPWLLIPVILLFVQLKPEMFNWLINQAMMLGTGSEPFFVLPIALCVPMFIFEISDSIKETRVMVTCDYLREKLRPPLAAEQRAAATAMAEPEAGAGFKDEKSNNHMQQSESPATSRMTRVARKLRIYQDVSFFFAGIVSFFLAFFALTSTAMVLTDEFAQEGTLLIRSILSVGILVVHVGYIGYRAWISSRLLRNLEARLDASGLLIQLATGGEQLRSIFDHTPWPWKWFLGAEPKDYQGWLCIVRNNIDWYLKPPRTLFRGLWIVNLLIPVNIIVLVLAFQFANWLTNAWVVFVTASALLCLLQIPLQQVFLRHAVQAVLLRAIKHGLDADSPGVDRGW